MLGDLRAAIAAGDWIHAVELALAEWRHTRAPALADIIDILGARCPVIEEKAERFHAWWMAEALPYRPASVSQLLGRLYVDLDGVQPSEMRTRTFRDNPLMGPLLEALAEGALRDDCGILDRLAAILAWPDDPRTARSLADFLCAAPLARTGTTSAIALRVVGERLASLADTRVTEQLRTCLREPRARSRKLRAAQMLGANAAFEHTRPFTVVRAELADALAELRELLGFERTVTAPVPVAAVPVAPVPVERDVPPHIEMLWAAVAADPDDLSARMVLGDALVELGDPRGQLIALQCNHRSGTLRGDDRPRALIRQGWKKWLGDLAFVIVRRGSEWRNGMLERVTIGKHDAPDWAYGKSRGHREMCAVETVIGTNCGASHLAAFVLGLPRDPHRLAVRGADSIRELAARRSPFGCRALVYQATWDYASRAEETFQRIAELLPLLEEIELDTRPYALPNVPLGVPLLPALFPALKKIRLSREAIESTRGERSVYAWLRGSPLVQVTGPAGA